MAALQLQALQAMLTDPKGGCLPQHELREFRRLLFIGENFEDPARSPFFHDGRGQSGIQSPGF